MLEKTKPVVGLALGGGAALGIAHIGVLEAFRDMDVPIDVISGTSIGAFVAALYALGVPPERLHQLALEMDWLDVAKISISKYGLLANTKLRKLLEKEVGEATFADTRVPLGIVATDISNGRKVILQEGDIATAIMASTALPGIFAPVSVGERMLVDGGLTENIPISALHRLGATFTLGVDLIYKRDYGKPRNIIDVLTNAIDIAINNGNLNYLRKADALIMPNLSGYDMVKNKDVEALVREGYTCAHLELQKIRQLDLI